MLVKMNASVVIDLIYNIQLFTTSWPAKAVQNRPVRFFVIRTTSYCNQCLAFINLPTPKQSI
jgi:hypothetical protein